MSKNNEQKRQKQLKRKRQKANLKSAKKPLKRKLPNDPLKLSKYLLDSKKLTTPKKLDKIVRTFCAAINPNFEPTFLTIEPEDWCRQSCCDLNVEKLIEQNGGKIICGYKIWYHPPFYIEAERHAVHESDTGILRDPTFSADGESRILFVADISERSKKLADNSDKIRQAIDNRLQSFVNKLNINERKNPIQKMSRDESWATMQTYEDWKKGNRQASVWVEPKHK